MRSRLDAANAALASAAEENRQLRMVAGVQQMMNAAVSDIAGLCPDYNGISVQHNG